MEYYCNSRHMLLNYPSISRLRCSSPYKQGFLPAYPELIHNLAGTITPATGFPYPISNPYMEQDTMGLLGSPSSFGTGNDVGSNTAFQLAPLIYSFPTSGRQHLSAKQHMDPLSPLPKHQRKVSESPLNLQTPHPFSPQTNFCKKHHPEARCVTTPSTTASSTAASIPKLKPMKLQFFKTKMCPWVIASGHCRKDQHCRYAHCLEDLRPLPDLTKTKMCSNLMQTGQCLDPLNCKYAHSFEELRATTSFSKTKICPSWLKGSCISGSSCRFAHGENEIRKTVQTPTNEEVENEDILQTSTPRPNLRRSKSPMTPSKTGFQQQQSTWSPSYGLENMYSSKQYQQNYANTSDQVMTHLLPSGIFTPLATKKQKSMYDSNCQEWQTPNVQQLEKQQAPASKSSSSSASSFYMQSQPQIVGSTTKEDNNKINHDDNTTNKKVYNPLCYTTPSPVYPAISQQYILPNSPPSYHVLDYTTLKLQDEKAQQKTSQTDSFHWNCSPYLDSLLTLNSFSRESVQNKDENHTTDSNISTFEYIHQTPMTQLNFPTNLKDDLEDNNDMITSHHQTATNILSTFGSDNQLRIHSKTLDIKIHDD